MTAATIKENHYHKIKRQLEGVLCNRHESDFNLCFRSLFPCGDTMVCIIDDREDVWNFASNMIHVKPYQFFKGVGDINAPPGGSPSLKEENSSPEQPADVPEMQGGDIKSEELTSQEHSKEEQEKSDTVFEENVNSEKTKSKAVPEEKTDLPNVDKNVDACENNTEPIVEKCKDNNYMKTIVETVEPSETSSTVIENGGSDNANDVTDEKESIKTLEQSNKNNKDPEQNNIGKAESGKEQKPSDCSDNTTDETTQQRSEGGECHTSGLSRNSRDNPRKCLKM